MKKLNVAAYLLEHKIKPSYQRKRIYEYLLEHRNHPNVNLIYEALIDEIPSLSKTTIYNTLKLFVQKNIVEEITIEGNEIRYDLYKSNSHGHFRCDICKNIYDIDLDEEKKDDIPDLKGFEVQKAYYHFKGICKDCLENQKKKT